MKWWPWTKIQQLEEHIRKLESRPDILALKPGQDYLIVFPEKTPEDEIQKVAQYYAGRPDILIVASDHLNIIQL